MPFSASYLTALQEIEAVIRGGIVRQHVVSNKGYNPGAEMALGNILIVECNAIEIPTFFSPSLDLTRAVNLSTE